MFTGSKKKLLDLIKRRGTVSVDTAAYQTDLAKTTLREHFLQLERDGYIRREYVRSGPGRPSLEYELTSKGNSLYPSHESALMREIVRFLKEKGWEETVEEFFEAFWDRRMEEAGERMDKLPDGDITGRIEVLMEMLEEEGFMPEYELDEQKQSLNVRECNCPFSELVKETRLPCRLEALFYEKLFNTEVKRTSYIAEGDHSCTYDISLEQSST